MQVPHRHKKRKKINIRYRITLMVLALMTTIGAQSYVYIVLGDEELHNAIKES